MASRKEVKQVNIMAQLLTLQERLAEQEARLEESVKKEEILSERLEEQRKVTIELKEDIKAKDEALRIAEERLKAYE